MKVGANISNGPPGPALPETISESYEDTNTNKQGRYGAALKASH